MKQMKPRWRAEKVPNVDVRATNCQPMDHEVVIVIRAMSCDVKFISSGSPTGLHSAAAAAPVARSLEISRLHLKLDLRANYVARMGPGPGGGGRQCPSTGRDDDAILPALASAVRTPIGFPPLTSSSLISQAT